MNFRPSTSTTDAFRAPVYKPIPAGVRITPTYSDGWVANTLPAIRPVTPDRHLPERNANLRDPQLGLGKGVSVSHSMFTWKPPDPPRDDASVSSWEPCNLSFQSSVRLGPAAPSPRALVPGATSPRKNATMKRENPVEFGYLSDAHFAGTPSGMGYRAAPMERVVTATVDFRHQQPKHNSGFKSNFNSGSLAEQFRQRWPEAPDGVSVSSHSFSNAAAEHDARFPPAPLAKGPGGSSERSGFNYSLKKLGPAAAPKALTSRTAHREMVPRMKLNVGPRNNMPQGSSPGLKTTVNYPPHHSGFMANFKQDRLAESMQSKFLPHNAASWSAATHVDLSAGDRAGPEIPYLRGPAHSSHRSAYSRSIPSQWLVD
mmetsp:Transcript_17337/g.42826  ORF Transcript_17337/g.42826 Transcript_17337/m.42826 type:complete len:371 (-) Transcript_17337:274-1386(-)